MKSPSKSGTGKTGLSLFVGCPIRGMNPTSAIRYPLKRVKTLGKVQACNYDRTGLYDHGTNQIPESMIPNRSPMEKPFTGDIS
ncbi:MAG: hypothetical protein CVU48_08670 [Candidatus Cloacimonetes bacterium HGW-Cloacimonetes-1]|nr:MAG: hypothetical protein CVU48_08670 [Candidatus Cloacimonetes bacterium HGW-Cloacimonetes-1]